jgi:hypothetical protein
MTEIVATKSIEQLAKEQMERLPATPVQLGFWPDDSRGVPNAFLRSAFFSARKPTARREFLEQVKLESKLAPALAPYTVRYTGPELFQPDLDVWLQIVQLCRLRPLGTSTDFQVRTFLKALGSSTGKTDRDRLELMFARLRATAFTVSWVDPTTKKHRKYISGLVDHLGFDEATGRWRVVLDPRIAELFAPSQHTWLQVSARRALGKGYLAKWLHGYFSSHAKPHPIRVAALMELSGSATAELKRFRQSLKLALAAVARVETAEGRRFEWCIDDEDLVHVRRS